MNGGPWRVVVVAAVAVLAITTAAATLEPMAGYDGADSDPSLSRSDATQLPPRSGLACLPWLATPWGFLGVIGGLGVALAAVRWRYSSFAATAVAAGVGLPVLLLYVELTACPVDQRPSEGPAALLPPPGGGTGLVAPSVPAVPYGPFLLVGLLLAGGLFVASLFWRSGSATVAAGPVDDDEASTRAARAAGRAAARLEAGADLETEVHRAWREMAVHLDVPRPGSSTPGEFADAALAADLPPDAVRELTTLFEEVRYGGLEATPERRDRARTALLRLRDRDDRPAGEDRGDG